MEQRFNTPQNNHSNEENLGKDLSSELLPKTQSSPFHLWPGPPAAVSLMLPANLV